MSKTSRGALSLNATTWTLLGMGVFIVLILVYFSWVGQYLAAALLGRDVASLYTPLVRHQISQQHCYDNGTQLCEKVPGKPVRAYEKEFTIAYLFAQPPKGLSAARTWACVDRTTRRLAAFVTKRADCTTYGGQSYTLGYIAREPNFEAPVALYTCQHPETKDALITVDPRECVLAGYAASEDAAKRLGYAASAGFQLQTRLEELCSAVATQCARGNTTLCAAEDAYCRF